MSCQDLNRAVAGTAKDISAAAVRRGQVDSYNVPGWLLGASRVQQRLVDRETRRIEDLRQRQDQAAAERDRKC